MKPLRPAHLLFCLIWPAAVLSGCAGDERPHPAPEADTGTGKLYGIDVSHHQKKIDWSKVKDWKGHKIGFVYIKATEGGTWVDPRYERNVNGARRAGLRVGSYHYFRPAVPAHVQFRNFKQSVDKDEQDLVPLVDVEDRGKHVSKADFHRNLQEFLDLIEQHYGMQPMIYSVQGFYNRHLRGRYSEYPLMVARFSTRRPVLLDDNSWLIWQFSEKGRVDGIPKYVDINVMPSADGLEQILLK